ncbi:MAG: hypothetical protein AB7F98_08085 [Novosphingobium sp.]
MDGDPAQAVWARIESALARIERAADRSRTADTLLLAKHDTLRGEVEQALLQLDSLIDGSSA